MRALLVVVLAASACSGTARHPPTARLAVSPEFVPLGDGYHTDVMLDGSASRNQLDDPQGLHPLRFHLQVDDARPEVRSGSLDEARATVRIAAARPTEVRLTVTDDHGESATAIAEVGVTIPDDAGP